MSADRQSSSASAPRVVDESGIDWTALEAVMHRDPGRRGLASYRPRGAVLDAGQLRDAALALAAQASSVALVTGFPTVLDDRVTAETDGPPGALFLAQALQALGARVTLITDRHALPLLSAGCKLAGIERRQLVEFPIEGTAAEVDAKVASLWRPDGGAGFSHLVAIERPGPSHTLESLAAQPRAGPAPLARFEAEVPAADRDACHNMRGAAIGPYTAATHRLFEADRRQGLPITTIGIGDGGNELGMGRYLWEDLRAAVGGDVAGRIVCRIATDHALIAGVSNWGAYALALAVARLAGIGVNHPALHLDTQRALIECLVAAGAVDGRTLRAEPTVDGLSLDVSLEVLAELHALLDRPGAASR